MKVCTDACILGAWFARRISQYRTILDIGAGTGVLMLMLAQKSDAVIDGIELDTASFEQLKENIDQNNWKERFAVYRSDVRSHVFDYKYDFIIANPPFFEYDLPSDSEREKLAKHSHELTLKELIAALDKNLSTSGAFGILLPFDRWEYFNNLAESQHFHIRERLFIRHSPSHDFSRAILYYGRHREYHASTLDMNIYHEQQGGYSREFVELMKDYYLYL